jgi:hypothetical protein
MTRPRFAQIVEQARLDDIPVLPSVLDPRGKHPAISWLEFQGRRPTSQEYREWVCRYGNRNGLYVLGPISGRFVVDPDTYEANEYSAKRIEGETQIVQTARGLHYHFAYPDFRVYNSASQIYPGIDIRGFGGVSVAVGSIHHSGYTYKWLEDHSPNEVELATAPNWLLDWLFAENARREHFVTLPTESRPFTGRVNAWARKAIDGELERLTSAAKGTRNDTLVRVSFKIGQLVAGGEADAGELRAALEAVTSSWTDERDKSIDTISRAFDEGMAHPRCAPRSKFKRRSPWAHTPGLAGEYEDGVEANG